jgi:tripartite-type tricarboxylate transporter receptor subunit TctC
MKNRRSILAALAALPLAPVSSRAQVANYPSKPVRIVLSNATGTAPDVAARVLAQQLQLNMGGAFVVDNKPGAGGAIAAENVSLSAPDGSTLLLGSMAEMALTPHIYKNLRYDIRKDFVAIGEMCSADLVFVINPEVVKVDTMQEYLKYAVSKQPLLVGTFGVGTPGHLAAAQLGDVAKLKLDPVHYRAANEGMAGVIAGDIQGIFVSIALSGPFIKSGKLKALAITAPTRSPVLPDVPTVRELGMPDLELVAWLGLFAPAKTPVAILDKLHAGMTAGMAAPDARKRLEDAGFRISTTSRDDFAKVVTGDYDRWGKAVARYNITAN